jgi:hypothetical protein
MLATWALMLGLGLSSSPRPPAPALLAWRHERERVSVWTDREAPYRRRDVVRVFASTRTDAYLTVFRIDTDGGLRVLFPRQPWEDTWVRGGRVVEVDADDDGGPGGFQVDDYPGVGYIFAVTSAEPFDYTSLVRGDEWDYREIANGRIHGDPYVAISDMAGQISPDAAYDYDVTPYYVEHHYDYPRFVCYDCHTYAPYASWNPYGAQCTRYRVVIYDDPYYYPYQAYGGRVVVPGRPARLQPRYVFEAADGHSAWVTRTHRTPAPGPAEGPGYREREPERTPWRPRESVRAPAPELGPVRAPEPDRGRAAEPDPRRVPAAQPAPPPTTTTGEPELRRRKPEPSAPPPGNTRRRPETDRGRSP